MKSKPILTAAELKVLKKALAKLDAQPVPDDLEMHPSPDDLRIETPRVKTGKKITNVKRAFWLDGANAYLRRKKANPAIIQRTDAKVKTGEYRHVRTSDDVEIYELADWSKLKRKTVNIAEMGIKSIERAIVKAACKEDWRLYYDAVSEYSYRFKNTDLPAGTQELMLQQSMAYLEHRIMRRGGPTPMRIQNELAGIRKERTGTNIYLPRGRAH